MFIKINICKWISDLRETENPNLSGYSAKSFLRRVDLPVPEGPETTMGRTDILYTVFDIKAGAIAMVKWLLRESRCSKLNI